MGSKKMKGRGLSKWPITHGGTGSDMVLPLLLLWVLVPISVVPVPI